MRRNLVTIFYLTLVLIVLTIAGCKDGVSDSELDLFIAQISTLDDSEQEVQLRELAAGEPPYSVYANYMIGNRFYMAAGETAREEGWNGGEVNALLDSSEVYFNLAVAADSTFIEALVNLGSLWDDRSEQMGNRQEREERIAKAKEYYSLALAVDPTDEKARCNLGALYLRHRETGKALAEFQTVLEQDPTSSLAHYNLAIMFAEQKIYREALAEWELAAKYDPDGDIGSRSRDNIEIVKELMNSPVPDAVQ